MDGIISGGQTMNPPPRDIMKEIDKTPAEVVYVLPNNKKHHHGRRAVRPSG